MTRKRILTRVHEAKLLRLKAARGEAMDRIYSAIEGGNTPFSQCYEKASPALRAAYDRAYRAVADYEVTLVLEGRGYRDASGNFTPYR
jgi:hypothetical protein